MPDCFLMIGAIFKNEAHSIREWVQHYFSQGVDHIYLINDASTDNWYDQIKDLMGRITVFTVDHPRYLGRQRNLYNEYFLPRLKQAQWTIITDMDEFWWSPAFPKLSDFFRNLAYNPKIAQIQVNHTLFGSNGHENQPTSLVGGFTRRCSEQPTQYHQDFKYAVNSDYEFESLNVHHATFKNPEYNCLPYFMMFGPDYLIMNHYIVQSRDFYMNTKCKRGDADHFLQRNEELFREYDRNDVEDLRLLNIHYEKEIKTPQLAYERV